MIQSFPSQTRRRSYQAEAMLDRKRIFGVGKEYLQGKVFKECRGSIKSIFRKRMLKRNFMKLRHEEQ